MPKILRYTYRLPEDIRTRARALASRWRKKHVWNPNQLRHSTAINLRREFGIEAAQVVLGHGDATLTAQVYAERDAEKARRVMAKVG